MGRYDATNAAAYTFVNLTAAPVDLLVGIDGFLYILSASTIAVITTS